MNLKARHILAYTLPRPFSQSTDCNKDRPLDIIACCIPNLQDHNPICCILTL